MAGTYLSTDHGNSTVGVDRGTGTQPELGAKGDTALDSYSRGNCAHCHEMHASFGSDEPNPDGDDGANDTGSGVNMFTLFNDNYDDSSAANTNMVCYYCHEEFTFTGMSQGEGRYGFYQGKSAYRVADGAHAGSGNSGGMTTGEESSVAATSGGPNKTDPGNCNNCHNPHGYDDNAGAPWTEPIPFMLFAREGLLCIGCHTSGGAGDDVATDVQKTHGSTSSAHKAADATLAADDYQEVHDITSEYNSIVTTQHVECVDCHNPHAATTVLHTQGTNAVSGALEGVVGVSATTPSEWTEPSYSVVNPATMEYQICYKCHSGANTAAAGFADWGGGSGSTAWTDVGLEFNPSNTSYHPVVAATSTTDRISGLTGGWSLGDIMYCSDCHESDSTVTGPHGSNTKWMLSGVRKAWPYTSASNNGSNTGTFWTYSTRNNGSGINRLFCLNCHAVGSGVHTEDGDHQSIPCVNCHIRVPHGGKLARLITTDTTNLPARYHPDGNNGGFSGGRALGYTDYGTSKSSCRVTGCGEHSTSAGLGSW
jgi:predicted CXXCH cytochrome family protein